jgi:undecaprenyl-diphosphatase
MTKKRKKAGKALLAADRKAHQAMLPYSDTKAVKSLSWLSELGDQPQMLTLSGGVLAWGIVRGDRRLVRAGGRMIASHLLATWIKNIVKHRVDRTRPFAARDDGDRKPKPARTSRRKRPASPPATAPAPSPWRRHSRANSPTSAARRWRAPGAIALVQIPRCAHYPTDVGAGLAIGWLSEWRWTAPPLWQARPAPLTLRRRAREHAGVPEDRRRDERDEDADGTDLQKVDRDSDQRIAVGFAELLQRRQLGLDRSRRRAGGLHLPVVMSLKCATKSKPDSAE